MSELRAVFVTDEELAAAAPQDEEAYGELIARYLPSVRRFSRLYTKSSADRDDLVSEGILGLLNAVKTYDPAKGASFSTYAGVCVNNRMLNALKRSARIQSREEALNELPAGGFSPEKIIVDREVLSEIFSEISENLTELERTVFVRYLNGESYEAISRDMGIDSKSVDNALARVRRKLRRKFR